MILEVKMSIICQDVAVIMYVCTCVCNNKYIHFNPKCCHLLSWVYFWHKASSMEHLIRIQRINNSLLAKLVKLVLMDKFNIWVTSSTLTQSDSWLKLSINSFQDKQAYQQCICYKLPYKYVSQNINFYHIKQKLTTHTQTHTYTHIYFYI